jgi:hypothetical protein
MRVFNLRSLKRCATLLACSLLAFSTDVRVKAQASSDPLPRFWRTDGFVNAIVVANNTAYIGGDFGYVGPANGAAGLVDRDFGVALDGFPKLNGTVRAIVPDGTGGWFVGGLFNPDGQPNIKNLVHVRADNTLDLSFSPNPDSTVRALALLPGALVVGGEFFQIATNQQASYLAFLNPTTGGTNGLRIRASQPVNALTVDGDTLYVGGQFTVIYSFNNNVQIQDQRQRLAAIKPLTGEVLPWNPTCTGGSEGVKALVVSATAVYAGGDFTQCGGKPRTGLASLTKTDGVANTWNPNPGNTITTVPIVNALALVGSALFVGGDFTSIGTQPRIRLAALQATGNFATALPAFRADANDVVQFITAVGTDILVGGKFNLIGGTSDFSNPNVPIYTGSSARRGFASIAQANGAVSDWGPQVSLLKPTTFGTQANATSYALGVTPTSFLLGGDFVSIGGVNRGRIAAIDLATGGATPWDPQADLTVRALALGSSGLYVGGSFTNIGGASHPRIALVRYDNGQADPWDAKFQQGQYVSAIAVGSSSVIVGGQFQKIGGQDRSSLAELEPTTGNATAWNPQPNGQINTLFFSKGNVYVGGQFFGFSGIPGSQNQYLALLTLKTEPAQMLVKTFLPTQAVWPDAQVRTLAISADNRLFVGGDFTKIAGGDHKGVAAIDPLTGQDTFVDTQMTGQGQIQARALIPLGSQLYIGGQFRGAGGENRGRIASVHNAFGVASGWDPGADTAINAIARTDNVVVIGGEFTRLGLHGANPNPNIEGQSVPYLAAFDARPAVHNIRKNAAGHYLFDVADGDGLGSNVDVQANDNLGAGGWHTLTSLPVQGIQDPYEDTTTPGKGRFYRLVRQP